MPEGDTIFRTAQTLHRVLAGRLVVRFDSTFPALTRVDVDRPIAGRTIDSVVSRGKHLLMTFSGDVILHTHMRMNGAWHLYRPGGQWRRPARDMRILVATADAIAVGFNVPVAEFLSARDVLRHRDLAALGPDLLDAGFDAGEARLRLRASPDTAAGDALLNQRAIAGIGNVLKSEVLFAAGIDPFTRVGQLSDADLDHIVAVARQLMAMSVRAAGRQTTKSLNPNARLWVYGRGGLPCRKCGMRVQAKKTGIDARLTYWCPRCQPPREHARSAGRPPHK